MKATVGNLRKLIKDLPDSAEVVTEDWDGSAIIMTENGKPIKLEGLLMVANGRLYLVNRMATENECHAWSKVK